MKIITTQKYKVDPTIEIREVETHIDNYDEISVNHPLINASFLYALIDDLKKISWVGNIHIASNGLIRISVEGITKQQTIFSSHDIAIHPDKESFIIIKGTEELSYYEDYIVKEIIKKIKKIKKSIKD